MSEVKIPPITVSFFVIFPTVALACAVAILASPEPRSWSFFASVVTTWIGLRGSAWFIHKMRDDVVKLEKITNATEVDIGLLSDNSEEKTEEPNSEHPQIVYHHVHLYKISQGLMRPAKRTIQIQHASVISMGIILGIRIFALSLFKSHPANLDFGSGNSAFENKFDSFFNLIQGAMASFFSYPAVSGLIARVFTTATGDSILLKKPNVYMIWFCEILSSCMTLLPSMVVILAAAEDFANFSNSAHLRKMMEWMVGYFIATSAGLYFSCIVQRVLLLIGGILNALETNNRDADQAIAYVVDKLVVQRPIDILDQDEEKEADPIITYGFGKGDEYKGLINRGVEVGARLITRLCQLLFVVTTILNGIFLGSTWEYESDDKASIPLMSTLIGVPIVVYGIIYFATNKSY